MKLCINLNDRDEVVEAMTMLQARMNGDHPAEVAAPEAAAPVAPVDPAPADPAPVPPAEVPTVAAPAPANGVTLDVIKAKVAEINSVDNTKLTEVKAALTAIGVNKIGELQPEQFEGFYATIGGLI